MQKVPAMKTQLSELSQTDAALVHAYLQGETEFQEAAAALKYSIATIMQWLCTPLIAETIKHIKSLELDRYQAIAARTRTTMMLKLSIAIEAAADKLSEAQTPKDGSPSPAALFFMRVATLLSRLATFKTADLKAATQLIAKVAQPNQPTKYPQPTQPRRYQD